MMTSQDYDNDLKLLTEAVRKAGAIAMSFYGKSPKAEDKKDGTQVSEADHAANDCLHDILMGNRPDYGWLSEETTDDLDRLSKDRLWIIDPIDGTRAFLDHKPEWAVSAALAVNGRAEIGIVFNPAKDEWYEAVIGRGASLNGKKIITSDHNTLENARFVGSKSFLKKDIWPSPWPPVHSRWANSIAYRLALVASAEADATLTHTPKNEWDMAASALIVEEAGGKVTTFDGTPLAYNAENPKFPNILAAGKELHKILLDQTRQIDWDKPNKQTKLT